MTVFLVGAGPGDPGLITVRGAELLARADVVIYDRLSAPSLLELVPESAQRIYVGKRGSEGSTPQERINELLVEHGSSASVVVRLKGGDPFVFARGAEELEVLRDAGIPAEVVPGITSAIAAPAYAGIPVTRRYSSTSVTIVTGHEDPTKERSEVDWGAIARVGGTIVVLMGVANIGRISERLIAGGLAPQTPVAAVRWGTRPNQHTTRASLATIAEHPLAAPSVIVIGDVAADELEWFAARPLTGRRVVVTRAPAQASRLTDRLLAAGEREKLDTAVVFSSSMAQYARGRPGLNMLVDFVDVDSAKWTQYASEHAWPMSWLYRREGRALLGFERRVASESTRAFFVTEKETALFRSLAPECTPVIQALCNGVDAKFFSPELLATMACHGVAPAPSEASRRWLGTALSASSASV